MRAREELASLRNAAASLVNACAELDDRVELILDCDGLTDEELATHLAALREEMEERLAALEGLRPVRMPRH